MAKTSQVPFFVRLGNALTLTLLRAGFKLRGPFLLFGNYRMHLLTVRGRKSGLPRTVSLAMIERNGKRYVGSVYGSGLGAQSVGSGRGCPHAWASF